MRTLSHPCLILIFTGLVAFADKASNDNRPEYTFQEAMYLETGQGDLAAAARLYEQLATAAGPSSELKLRARWRWALCQEKLGNIPQAVALHQALLELIKETDSPELKQVRDAAAQSMLRIAEQATREGDKKLGQEILQSVSKFYPQAVEQRTQTWGSIPCKLRVVIDTWDHQRPVNANIRIRAQTKAALLSSTTIPTERTWQAKTDAAGRLEIELPPGQYEVRASAPFWKRKYGTATLMSENRDPVEVMLTLERIKLPATIYEVRLAGNWLDNWVKTLPLAKVAPGIWETQVHLMPGSYEYKFRINDLPQWITDVRASDFVVGRDDFNARLVLEKEQDITFRFDENDPHFERSPP